LTRLAPKGVVGEWERAGLSFLNENQKLSYEIERGQQGKTSAVNLQTE